MAINMKKMLVLVTAMLAGMLAVVPTASAEESAVTGWGSVSCNTKTGKWEGYWSIQSNTRFYADVEFKDKSTADTMLLAPGGIGTIPIAYSEYPGGRELSFVYELQDGTEGSGVAVMEADVKTCTRPTPPPYSEPKTPKTLNGCNGVYSGVYNNVYVKRGQNCILTEGAVIVGNVRAWRASSLYIYTHVQGGLLARRVRNIVQYAPVQCNTPGEYVSSGDIVITRTRFVRLDCVKTKRSIILNHNKNVRIKR